MFSLLAYIAVYAVIYAFGLYLHLPPAARRASATSAAGDMPAIAADAAPPRIAGEHADMAARPVSLALFWAGVIAVAILVYVILDGFDLGVGILFGTTADNGAASTDDGDRSRRSGTATRPGW